MSKAREHTESAVSIRVGLTQHHGEQHAEEATEQMRIMNSFDGKLTVQCTLEDALGFLDGTTQDLSEWDEA